MVSINSTRQSSQLFNVRTGHLGEVSEEAKTYHRIVPDILLSLDRVDFDVYAYEHAGRLTLIARAGQSLPFQVRNDIHYRIAPRKRYYVRGDQLEQFLQAQENLIGDLLDSSRFSLEAKCDILHNHTALLSLRLFERPSALAIEGQKRNIARMVHFTLKTPVALENLLRLTSHDYYTYTHCVNVGLYSLWLLSHTMPMVNQDPYRLERIACGFFLHDIGKTLIDLKILNKPAELSEAEWRELFKHPHMGQELLKTENQITPEAAVIVGQHHERMDGCGYPDGLKGEDIHPFARICALTDTYDALTTRRPYRDALEPFNALRIMKEEMRDQLDPHFFEAFVRHMRKKD
ncbi:MAG TPA: HD domain-containing phosphohydrolase [Candidatus Sumerlaeota bacterium]|nr:HD domain-containing phosphohydrolase [Candidatus Sumerlaeota bacterium]